MISPTLDLDMNLDSPSWKDSGADGVPDGSGAVPVGGNASEIQLASNNASVNVAQSSETPVEDDSSPNSSERTVRKVTVVTDDGNNSIVETKQSNKHNLEEKLELVETWREEAAVMSVKNAILLDDLVKVGADI